MNHGSHTCPPLVVRIVSDFIGILRSLVRMDYFEASLAYLRRFNSTIRHSKWKFVVGYDWISLTVFEECRRMRFHDL